MIYARISEIAEPLERQAPPAKPERPTKKLKRHREALPEFELTVDTLQGRWRHSVSSLGMLTVRGSTVQFDVGNVYELEEIVPGSGPGGPEGFDASAAADALSEHRLLKREGAVVATLTAQVGLTEAIAASTCFATEKEACAVSKLLVFYGVLQDAAYSTQKGCFLNLAVPLIRRGVLKAANADTTGAQKANARSDRIAFLEERTLGAKLRRSLVENHGSQSQQH
ncbi:hypothetical protein AK812_SmicGene23488 [Symbiodinium microadriaticum]|uniref:Uncharacterized protein n=1 Tax=Symbiodinium microadriaticum TaxID=2951 RepID=A0A1Q9DH46_SYMMI|nr:hypothetical protein AK812_SmicGene23488 [Symbiodinium microadriaticum]